MGDGGIVGNGDVGDGGVVGNGDVGDREGGCKRWRHSG